MTLANVAVEFGEHELYRDVNLFVGPKDRVGLVGPNGSGKTTVFRLIAGELTPGRGSVQVQRGTRIAYLPQTGGVVSDRTVLEEALTAFGDLKRAQRQMVDCEQRMSAPALGEAELRVLLDRYARLQHRCEESACDCEARAKKVLSKLGFGPRDFEKRVSEQSGGFQVRLTLGRMLLEEPDLLLLDEPTNYLDIRSIEWLQEYLARFGGAYVMVAHDRYLLDGLVKRIWAVENRRVLVFNGNYTGYLADKEARERLQQKRFEEQQAFIKRTKDFVAKFKGRKDTAKRALSRQKMLDRLELVESPISTRAIRIRFPEAEEIYGKVFELDRVSKAFNGRQVLGDARLVVKGCEKVGLFGANGSGKTTLLRVVAKELSPDQGRVWWSQKVRVSFYEQGAEEQLDLDKTVLAAVAEAAEGYTENELKAVLGTFLFSGDAIDKKVRVLSGGEKSRLAIIRVLLTASNLLILDEPTNHLDFQSREVLFEAIKRYRRTVVFAAHDRYMLDVLADKTVRVEDGAVVLFPGNYTYASSCRERPDNRSESPTRAPVESRPRPKVRDAAGTVAKPDPIGRLRERLVLVRREYETARDGFDLVRARGLAAEERELELEIEHLKADQLENSREP